MKVYTLLCVRPDGSRPTLEVAPAEDDAAARVLARKTLQGHDSCACVEVWDEDALLFTVEASEL
jgi:hypothetical protein